MSDINKPERGKKAKIKYGFKAVRFNFRLFKRIKYIMLALIKQKTNYVLTRNGIQGVA